MIVNQQVTAAGPNADEIAASISQAACELGDIPDPEGDDTISITVRDLEAVAHRHVAVAIERAVGCSREGGSNISQAALSNMCRFESGSLTETGWTAPAIAASKPAGSKRFTLPGPAKQKGGP